MDLNSNGRILLGSQPASLGGNTYQYESINSGHLYKSGGRKSRRFQRKKSCKSRRRRRLYRK